MLSELTMTITVKDEDGTHVLFVTKTEGEAPKYKLRGDEEVLFNRMSLVQLLAAEQLRLTGTLSADPF